MNCVQSDMETTLWVVTARLCSDCGGEMSVAIFAHEPTLQERRAVKASAGGNYCISLTVTKCERLAEPERAEDATDY
jgi:hypothetical protein